MGASYHQFCPVAKAMELLDERWTMLVIRELMAGSEHFNDLRRGLPRMSPTLLSRRLAHLHRAGVVDRLGDGGYVLSAAGRELIPIVEAVGAWGIRWIGELGEADLDPKLLLWDMRRHVDHAALPPGRTVIRFEFPEVTPKLRTWWLVMNSEDADVCDIDPGHDVTITVRSSLRVLIEVWRGDVDWSTALRRHALELVGPGAARRALPTWFRLSAFAAVPRPATTLAPGHPTARGEGGIGREETSSVRPVMPSAAP